LNKDIVENFDGIAYRLADNWYGTIDVQKYKSKPINYLEIGAFYGANLLSVANTYANHQESKLYAIDPWEDYDDYPEYKTEQNKIYKQFLENINSSKHKEKIIVNRGYSHTKISEFKDNFFDIIYIDGNHEPDYVLEDAVLSFRKLKNQGIMIFDDYGWGGPDLTKRGIDSFVNGYHKKIEFLGMKQSQVFVKKI